MYLTLLTEAVCQSLLLESLLLKKLSDCCSLLPWHELQHALRRVEVPPHDGGLVLEHGHQQMEAHHVELLVAQVEAVVLRDVAQQVHGTVQVRHHHDLPAHVVVEPVDAVGVDEAVAHPQPGLHGLTHLPHHIEGVLDTVLADLVRVLRGARLGVELADGVRLVGDDAAELPGLAPVDGPRLDLDPADELLLLPVVEGEPRHGLDAEQRAAEDCLRSEVWSEGFPLLEILEKLDGGAALPDGVLGAVPGPDEL